MASRSSFLLVVQGLSLQCLLLLPSLGSRARGLSSYGPWLSCPQHVVSSRPRDWTPDSCIGKWNLYPWTTSKVPTSLTWAVFLRPGDLVGPCFLTVCSGVFFSIPFLDELACNSIYWPRYVSSLPGTQIHFLITSSRGQGWGGAFKGYLNLFSCPQEKKYFQWAKLPVLFLFIFSRNSFEQKHLFVPVGWWPFSAIRGAIRFLGDLFHSGNLKSLGPKHDLFHEAVKQGG